MNFLRSGLGLKLFASYLLVILISVSVVWFAAWLSLPRAYQRHLLLMEQSMGAGMGLSMGKGQGKGGGVGAGGGMMAQYYQEFQKSFNESLLVAIVAASVVAGFASALISRGVLAPISSMSRASERIAEGRYDERVPQQSRDELGQLAQSFNRMAERLEQVETMRRQLIGDVAHELRTPLTTIKGYAEGLMDAALPADEETFRQIHSEAERLNRLVDDLQELSRVESRAIPLDIRRTDAAAVVGVVVKRMKPQFEAKGVTLTTSLPAEGAAFLADEGRAVQILTNLVGNALQHTPAGGKVEISVQRERDEAKVSVRDTGEGIEAEHLPRIFDRFYRADKSRSRARGGSGVGLTIAKGLAEAQGGRIWAESEGKNKGSAFHFTLPIA